MLIGMAVTFAAVASLAAIGGSWAVDANELGRHAALVLLAGFGLLLLFPGVASWATRPLVAWGTRLSGTAAAQAGTFGSSLLLGIATGLLWAPCAGPVLGLILTGAALNGANASTTTLLLAYALGAATSLALALLAGGQVLKAMKASLGAGEWLRRGAGVLVLLAVTAIGLGVDTGFLTRASLGSTSAMERQLIALLMPASQNSPSAMRGGQAMMAGGGAMMSANPAMMAPAVKDKADSSTLTPQGPMPSIEGAVQWRNSPPLSEASLRGKVVLVDFWTYSCINCLRTIPYVRAWAEKYKDQGLVVIGVHSPEFAFEKKIGNVEKAIADLGIAYPVAIDNDYAIWRAFQNQYWPAHYFIDANGQVRHHHFGEGDYEESERVIQRLLAEAGQSVASGMVAVQATGAAAASNTAEVLSPETYVGYVRSENFVSGEIVHDQPHNYAAPDPRLNEWGLTGDWTIGSEHAALNAADGSVSYRFHARDLHLVLGTAEDGKPIRFIVTIDGKPPGDAHGLDIDAAGYGTVTDQRLYQLIRQTGPVIEHTFEIRFLDPGVQAFAFTFG